MKKFTILLAVLFLGVMLSNCTKKLDQTSPGDITISEDTNSMNSLVIPEEFNFETAREIQVNINGTLGLKSKGLKKYEIYLFNSEGAEFSVVTISDDGDSFAQSGQLVDVMNNLIATQITEASSFTVNLTIPSCFDSLYVVENDFGNYSSVKIPINNKSLTVDFFVAPSSENMEKSSKNLSDILYAVNRDKELYSFNPETGEVENLPNMPFASGGSVACAIDPVARVLYAIGYNYPYRIYEYDIDNESWSSGSGIYVSGPRLAYNINDGLLYYSFNDYIYLIDPYWGWVVSYYKIYGLDDEDGGDLCFAENGRLYISSESGLYKCEFLGGNHIDAIRISADNLPNYPNSLTFDQNQELWWATNIYNEEVGNYVGQTYIMDTVTGGYEERWTFEDHYIHDLATLPLDENQIPDTDTDGDGIIDFYDEYPNDGDRAYDTYTPSIYGWGTYAFEDLWPNEGDYDFNDLVLNYRYTHVYNSSDEIVETIMNFNVKNVGGSFNNGFGIELDMDESLIQSVIGTNITQGVVTLNGKGLEAGQEKPVVILFDDAWANVNVSGELELLISYNSPIETEDFGAKNPFIFVNGDRGREVHLSDFPPTTLANTEYFGTGDDDSNESTGRYYKNVNNLPWAIDIMHDFVYLEEKVAIIYGYNRFDDWAESGGTEYTDWYKDQDGYRNDQYLVYD